MAADSLSTTYSGRVVSVNERGLKLDGHDSWLNVSRFAVGVVLPERGATVSVACDPQGFIRAVTPLDGPVPTNGQYAAPGASTARHEPSAKDRTITRLAVLKAAAEYAASKPESKSTDVLAIAACWERWVNRAGDEPDLDEAF